MIRSKDGVRLSMNAKSDIFLSIPGKNKATIDSTDLSVKLEAEHMGYEGAPLGMTPCQASFRLELSVRMSDVKWQCQKALCLACLC